VWYTLCNNFLNVVQFTVDYIKFASTSGQTLGMHLTIVRNGSDISVLPFFRPCYMAGKAS